MMRKDDKRAGWGYCEIGIGAAAVIAVIAAPTMPQWAIDILLFIASFTFSLSTYHFQVLKKWTGRIFITAIWVFAMLIYFSLGPAPEISFVDTEVHQSSGGTPMFLNIGFQNVGTSGRVTTQTTSVMARITADPKNVHREMLEMANSLLGNTELASVNVGTQEKRWISAYAPQPTVPTPAQYAIYFDVMVRTKKWPVKSFEYCAFIVSTQPTVVNDCLMD